MLRKIALGQENDIHKISNVIIIFKVSTTTQTLYDTCVQWHGGNRRCSKMAWHAMRVEN